MLKKRIAMALGLAAALFGVVLQGRAIDESGVDVQPDRSFVHYESKTGLKVPLGWNIINPYRLRKTTLSTVMGLEKENPMQAITIVWSPIGNRPFSDFIRAAADEQLGEEYALLQTVYGKTKVGRPTTINVGPYQVYKILIEDGPDRDGRFAGAVYLFEAGTGENRWRVKIRAVYPATNREKYIKEVEDVINTLTKE